MNKVLHYFVLSTLSLIILVLLLFNYYVLFESTKEFDINNTGWSYWKELINPHMFKLFYVYLFFLGVGLLSLITHFIYKLKTKVSIYLILFSIIGVINIWSFEYFEIPRIIIEANRSNPSGFIEPELPLQYSNDKNNTSDYQSTESNKSEADYSYQERQSTGRINIQIFDSSQMSDRDACGREKLIDRIIVT